MEFLVTYLKEFFDFIMKWAFEISDAALMPVALALPELDYDVSFLARFTALANQWVALDYGLILFLCWCGFCLSLAAINWLLGLIPTIN